MKRILLSAAAAIALIAAGPALAQTPKQGGDAIVTFNNDLTTLDPQVGYDWQNWSVIKSIFDGLMDYEPGSTISAPTWRRATASAKTARPIRSSCAA